MATNYIVFKVIAYMKYPLLAFFTLRTGAFGCGKRSVLLVAPLWFSGRADPNLEG